MCRGREGYPDGCMGAGVHANTNDHSHTSGVQCKWTIVERCETEKMNVFVCWLGLGPISLSNKVGKIKQTILCRHCLSTFSVKATGTERGSSCCPAVQHTRGISNVNGVCSKKLENWRKGFWPSWP